MVNFSERDDVDSVVSHLEIFLNCEFWNDIDICRFVDSWREDIAVDIRGYKMWIRIFELLQKKGIQIKDAEDLLIDEGYLFSLESDF